MNLSHIASFQNREKRTRVYVETANWLKSKAKVNRKQNAATEQECS
jgi:hypothetical protein